MEIAKLVAVGIFGGTPSEVLSKIEFQEGVERPQPTYPGCERLVAPAVDRM